MPFVERERPSRAGGRATRETRITLALRIEEDGIGAIVDDANSAEYLQTMRRFRQYSLPSKRLRVPPWIVTKPSQSTLNWSVSD